jgi:uncharacterized protein (DUF58 family)
MGGLAYVLTTGVMVVGAVNGQNNLLFWFFGLAVAGLIVSGVLSGWVFIGLSIRRVLPGPGQVGIESRIEYRLVRRGLITPGFGLLVEELDVEGGGRPVIAAMVAHMPARGEAGAYGAFVPTRRGVLRLRRVRVYTSFPFGLVGKSVTFDLPEEMMVKPAEATVPRRLLMSLGGKDDAGARRRPSRSGEEFFSLREFGSGDSVRSVAWRATARMGRPLVREMSDRSSRRVVIEPLVAGLDEARAERLVSVAAGLARAASRAGWRVGLAWGERSVRLGMGGGRDADRVAEALAVDPASLGSDGGDEDGLGATRIRVVDGAGDGRSLGSDDAGVEVPALVAGAAPGAGPAAQGRWWSLSS